MARMKLTHIEHVELAALLMPAFETIQNVAVKVANVNGVSSREAKKMMQLLRHIDVARSELDSAYHAVTNKDEFLKHGHVYYTKGIRL
jgi:hypothetical protein